MLRGVPGAVDYAFETVTPRESSLPDGVDTPQASQGDARSKPKAGLRIGFVTPRYGPGVVGGAEGLMAEAARGLRRRGHEVEILTTTARSHYTFANEFSAGVEKSDGLLIRRFDSTVASNRRWATLERRMQLGLTLRPRDEPTWAAGTVRTPGLPLYLASHARGYDALILAPYPAWTTLQSAGIAPERTILLPCLHDEPYARLGLVAEMLEQVAEVWFLSEPEHLLAHRLAHLAPYHRVVGGAVEVPTRYGAAEFRRRHHLERPFLLYAGRREDGKGWRQLTADFGLAVLGREVPFDLVTVGVGEPSIPRGLGPRIHDLGYLSDAELADAMAAAEALLQPSRNESFSRTVMQAWLAGTLVIATDDGEVVRWHCEASGGGLTYRDGYELGQCLSFLAAAPKRAAAMAARGREYVLSRYTWPSVLDSMEEALGRFDSAGSS